MAKAILRSPACRSCRATTLQSFTASFLDIIPPSTLFKPRAFLDVARFSHGRSRLSDQPLQASSFPKESSDSTACALSPPSSSDPIPWYLQVSIPTPPTPSHPLADRQLIPSLPPNPPPLLPPMLSYLSIESGLDNLTLLDLRTLDPPPALGAKLLMILGTARSVKHLNVSADRLCRWLRSNYKLRPYADGLLGRNELKLKLRRKARRAKLAASVGNTMYEKGGGADDGITTGWICVNVGQVEDVGKEDESLGGDVPEEGATSLATAASIKDKDEAVSEAPPKEEEEEYINPDLASEDQDPNYVGFGSWSNAPRIVVQMFTEEKRAELDLEGLWQDRSRRRTRKADIEEEEEAEVAMEEDESDLASVDGAVTSLIAGRTASQRERLAVGG